MKTADLPAATEAAIWARVIHPNGELTPQVARTILQLEFSEADRQRMHELSEKAQEGALSAEEIATQFADLLTQGLRGCETKAVVVKKARANKR